MQLIKLDKSQLGVGLIEILISVVIISISLLGLGALITTSLQTNQSAYAHTTASTLIYDFADRIRSNSAQNYAVNLSYSPPDAPDQSCELNSCTPLQMRNYDVNQWLQLIQTNLTNGDASINIVGQVAQITIVWLSGVNPSDNNTDESLQIQVNI
ncbi:MAG: type IV pilus modification protein PilV [Saccharospirillaceae bacterium]|nr:type IV pilus modification protein PilV [Pseudomonadales bacterium]NRB79267.1 type IV pilus modification protein PilV [Saccharospirillaceae bacterium]